MGQLIYIFVVMISIHFSLLNQLWNYGKLSWEKKLAQLDIIIGDEGFLWYFRKKNLTINHIHLSTDNWVPHSGILLYLHHINFKIFSILQSLTTSKMRKFQTLKLSQFHKEKTCWTKTGGLVGLWATFEGSFSMFWGAKKKFKIFLRIF